MYIIDNTEKAKDDFGHNYGSATYSINKEDLKALLEGKCLADTINDEYSIFIVLDKEEK